MGHPMLVQGPGGQEFEVVDLPESAVAGMGAGMERTGPGEFPLEAPFITCSRPVNALMSESHVPRRVPFLQPPDADPYVLWPLRRRLHGASCHTLHPDCLA